MGESDEFGVVLAFYELRNGIHRSRAVKRHGGDDIFYACRAKLFHELLEARRFYLENRLGVSRGEQFENLRVVISLFIEVDFDAVVLLYIIDCHFDIGKVS